MRKLNFSQRVVLVVALGFVCLAVEAYLRPAFSGWFAYAPNTGDTYVPDEGRGVHLALRVFLAAAWAVGCGLILRRPKE